MAGNSFRPAIVRDFYQNAAYANPDIPAFNNDGVTGDNAGNKGNGNGPYPPADSGLLAGNLAGGDRPGRSVRLAQLAGVLAATLTVCAFRMTEASRSVVSRHAPVSFS